MASGTLLRGGTLVTVDPDDRVVEGDLLVRAGRIAAIGRLDPGPDDEILDVRGCLVLPGLVQVHVHLCQALLRGRAEDRELLPWLRERVWPYEAAHDARSLEVSARLGLAELLLSGTTCALDMGTVAHTDAIFRAADRAGFRLTGGKAMMDRGRGVPAGLKEATRASVEESCRLADRWHGAAEGRLRYAFAPRFVLSCSPALLRAAVEQARRRGALLHTHASENPAELEAVRAAFGKPNVAVLHDLGMTGPDVVLAHCVHVGAAERRLLARTRTGVAHCPSTNLKLGSGIAPVFDLLERGVRVGLGADGAPCNNRMNLFDEMRLAALLQKPGHGAAAMPARSVVRMATLGGAEVLGLDSEIGSLEVGKRADLLVLDTARAALRPRVDPFTSVVFGANGSEVRDVCVDGRWLVRDSELVREDLGELFDAAEHEITRLERRAGA